MMQTITQAISGTLGDQRSDEDVLRDLRMEYVNLRQLNSRFNVQSYEQWRRIEELEMEMTRRKWEQEANRAWFTGQPTRGPSWDTLGREAPGRMNLDG